MNALSSLFIEFRASLDKFHDDLGQVSRDIRAFDRDMKPVTDRINEFGHAATNAGILLTASVTAPIAAFAGAGISFNALYQNAMTGFTTLLGSGEKAKAFLEEMKDFAAKTPFEFPDLITASQRLLAMGFTADQIKPTLTAVGNAIAALGKGAPEIDRVTLALGQMQGRGRVATQEMNQLTEVGIPAWAILAQKLGVTETHLRSMVEQGLVPANTAVQALIEGMNKPGMMDAASRNFTGLISTIKDETRFLAGDLTKNFFDALQGPTAALAEKLHDFRMSMKGWSDETKIIIGAIAGIGAAAGPALISIGQLALGVNNLIALYGRLQPVVAAVNTYLAGVGLVSMGAVAGVVALGAAIGIAIGTFINWAIRVTGLEQSFDRLVAAIVRTIPILGPWITGANAMADASHNLSTAQQKLVEEFKKHDVQVDISKLNDSQYLALLWEQSRAWATHSNAIKGDYGPTMADYNKILADRKTKEEAAAEAAKAHSAEVKRVVDAFADSLIPASAMNEQLRILTQHFSEQDIITLYGKKIIEAADAQRAHGYEVTGAVAKLEALTRAVWDAEGKIYDYASALAHAREEAKTFPMPIGQELGINVPVGELPTLPKVGIQPTFGPVPSASTEQWDHWKREGQKAIDNVVNDMSRMFVDGIIHGKNMWDSFKNLGQNAVAGIVDTLMKHMLHSFLDPLSTAVGHMLDTLTKGLTDTLAGWGKQLAGLFGNGAAGAASSAAGGATGAAGSIPGVGSVGGAASSAGGMFSGLGTGLISGGIAAAGSLLGSMRLEGTMNAVEYNTRASRIHLEVMINDFFWPMRTHTEWILHHAGEHTNQLDAIYNVLAGRGTSGGGTTVGAGGVTVNIGEVNVVAPRGRDPESFGAAFAAAVRKAFNESLITDADGTRSNVALVAKQTSGIVTTVPAT